MCDLVNVLIAKFANSKIILQPAGRLQGQWISCLRGFGGFPLVNLKMSRFENLKMRRWVAWRVQNLGIFCSRGFGGISLYQCANVLM